MMVRLLLTVALTAMFGLGIGCSDRAPDMPDLGMVHGKITLDGKPLSGVSIYFKPNIGRMSIAKADGEGTYEALYLIDEKGVKVGPNTVTVEWGVDESGPAIPPKYGIKSDLKLDVKPGENTFDIEMTSK